MNFNHAIEVANKVWWVGSKIENDPFQCHTYLIENGKNSVLVDIGSKITFPETFKKIEEIIPFSNIKYFIIHHQDPDITGSLPFIDQIIYRKDAYILTHWRTEMLIKHYDLKNLNYMLIEKMKWKLELSDRTLEFIFTPYAHFPGAFVTFDHKTKVLFSSDLFGGITDEFSLFAKDESYFESMKPFHQHYMPSNDILQYAMSEIERYPVEIILPQHGSIIKKELINYMISNLKTLDCGLYLLTKKTTDITKIVKLNQILKDITKTMVLYRDFKDVVKGLLSIIESEIQIKNINFYIKDTDEIILYSIHNQYRGLTLENNSIDLRIIKLFSFDSTMEKPNLYFCKETNNYVYPIYLEKNTYPTAVITIDLKSLENYEILEIITEQIKLPLQVAIERELIYRQMDKERIKTYERSIRDPLTNLFTRIYMTDIMSNYFFQNDRNDLIKIGGIILDIDHFKNVNDTFGHIQGDIVLKKVAKVVLDSARKSDIPIRFGGEEFILFTIGTDINIVKFAERLRNQIAKIKFDFPMGNYKITASFGCAFRNKKENIDDFIARIDKALYKAKETGRNKVVFDENSN